MGVYEEIDEDGEEVGGLGSRESERWGVSGLWVWGAWDLGSCLRLEKVFAGCLREVSLLAVCEQEGRGWTCRVLLQGAPLGSRRTASVGVLMRSSMRTGSSRRSSRVACAKTS